MEVRQPSLCPQSWPCRALLRPGSTSSSRPRKGRVLWVGPGLGMEDLGELAKRPLLCLGGRGCYLQLGLEDHNQDGEGDTHCHTVRQAQEEGGEEAHHPDTL